MSISSPEDKKKIFDAVREISNSMLRAEAERDLIKEIVKEISDTREFPFFIQWLSADHPSQDGTPLAEIEKIVIADRDQLADSWFKDDILASLGDVVIEWVDPSTNDDQSGIVAVHLVTPGGVVVLD